MENFKLSGYVTEKILNAFYSGAIPIYYGCDEINNYFNKDAFINVSNFKSLQDCVNYVINLSEDEIIKMQNQPFYNKTNEIINLFNNNFKKNKTLDKYINYFELFLKKKVHLITYGDLKYYRSKRILLKEAKDTGWFNTLSSYGPDDIDKEYKLMYKDILNQSRGGGYWIWKNYFIRKRLNEIDEGDILIYMDAGCGINVKGYKRFLEYINILKDNDIIAFHMNNHIEKYWTTNEIFEYFNADDNIKNSGQIIATVKIIKKNKNTINLFNLEDNVYRDNKLLVTDFYNNNQNEYFIDNRHDQSIYSVLIKKYNNVFILNDKTLFENFKNEEALKEPFHALRRKIKYKIKDELLIFINDFILNTMKFIKKYRIIKITIIFLIYYFLGFIYLYILIFSYSILRKIKKIIE